MTHQITIRAMVNEAVDAEGVGYPESVTVTGADALSAGTVREIAQEAVDSLYGAYGSGYIVPLGFREWEGIKTAKAPVLTVRKA
jgi:hypothetical protein